MSRQRAQIRAGRHAAWRVSFPRVACWKCARRGRKLTLALPGVKARGCRATVGWSRLSAGSSCSRDPTTAGYAERSEVLGLASLDPTYTPRARVTRRAAPRSVETRRLVQIELAHVGAVFLHLRAVELEVGLGVGRDQGEVRRLLR